MGLRGRPYAANEETTMMKFIFYCVFFILLTFSLCGKKEVPLPSLPVLDVIGKAQVTLPSHECKDAFPGMAVPAGSQVLVAYASRMSIGENNFRMVSATENTVFSIDSIIDSGPRTRIVVRISEGKILCSINAHIRADALGIGMIDHDAAVALRMNKGGERIVIKAIGGSLSIAFPDSQLSIIPSCCKMLIGQGLRASDPIPLSTKDFEEIVWFMGKNAADSMIDNALCPQTIKSEQNLPPQWEKTPSAEGQCGSELLDTLFAIDPEGSPVTYQLIDGPKGMTIDAKSGLVRFFPKSPAIHSVQVAAFDSSNASALMTFELIVTAPSPKVAKPALHAIINLPGGAMPGELIHIDASRSATSKASLNHLSFRFDFNGDGIWDYPSNTAFGAQPIATHAFATEGVYTICVQVKDADGKTAVARNKIVVHAKPHARISPSPQTITVDKECIFDAGASSVSAAAGSFDVRWDLDNNGTWDFPEKGGYTTVKTVKKAWRQAGRYTVVCEIRDGFGSLAWASAEVTVLPAPAAAPTVAAKAADIGKPAIVKAGGPTDDAKRRFDTAAVTVAPPPPVARAGEDIVSKKGKNVTLRGSGENAEGRIALYEWDFDANGVYDWASPKKGEIKHRFENYSNAILRVTDKYGATATDTLRVVICPEGMTAVESGPFCIDNFEWPNIRGKEPLREISFIQAREKCGAVGKRLCTGKEWEAACAGRRGTQYPKSSSPDEQNCNVSGNRSFANRIAPSGSLPDCKSPAGIFDMNGNVCEWTDEGGSDSGFVYGGSWHHDLANALCSSKLPLAKSRGYFYVGFRCCK
jgi:hypothetical protein